MLEQGSRWLRGACACPHPPAPSPAGAGEGEKEKSVLPFSRASREKGSGDEGGGLLQEHRPRSKARTRAVAAGLATLAWLSTLPVAAPAVVAAAAGGSAACEGNDCLGDTMYWGSCTQGVRVDANTWISTAMLGEPWLDDHGQRTWVLDPTPLMGRRIPYNVIANVSFSALPNASGGNGWTTATGNEAEFTITDAGQISVFNNTCSELYLQVVASYADVDGGASDTGSCATDGGT